MFFTGFGVMLSLRADYFYNGEVLSASMTVVSFKAVVSLG